MNLAVTGLLFFLMRQFDSTQMLPEEFCLFLCFLVQEHELYVTNARWHSTVMASLQHLPGTGVKNGPVRSVSSGPGFCFQRDQLDAILCSLSPEKNIQQNSPSGTFM